MAGAADRYNKNRNTNSNSYNDDQVRYSVRYAYDANAALQPEYIPYPQPQQPQRAPKPRPRVLPPVQKPEQRPQQQPRTQKKRFHAMLMLGVIAVAIMAFAVVMRNSEIYQNNRNIQAMGSDITQATHQLNTAKQTLSSKEDMGQYMDMAENDLNMVFPDEDSYIIITSQAVKPVEQEAQNNNGGNVIDDILDWFSSLERRG